MNRIPVSQRSGGGLSAPSTVPARLPGELLSVGRHCRGTPGLASAPGHDAASRHRASRPQPRASHAPVNRSIHHARPKRSQGMKHRSNSTRLATRQRKLSGRQRVSSIGRSCRIGLPETANKHGSRNPLPAYHEAEQFEMTDLLASLSAPGKRLGACEAEQPAELKEAT